MHWKTSTGSILLAAALSLAVPALADTPTATESATSSITPTFTPSPTTTATTTATPGEGFYSYRSVDANGNAAALGIRWAPSGTLGTNTLEINYTVQSFWSGGQLSFVFPAGFDPPSASNFWLRPAWNYALWPTTAGAYGYISGGAAQGGTVTVQLTGTTPGMVLTFEYGAGSQGFNYSGANLTETVQVWASPISAGTPPPIPGGLVVTPAEIPVWTPNATPTVTPTYTISPTVTPTPTAIQSATVTPTFTMTPIGLERPFFYGYPNPFDTRRAQILTWRFPASSSASITVYNLVGNPVARIPAGNIWPSQYPTDPSLTPVPTPGGPFSPVGGLAIWDGRDDLGEDVAGGLYFAVLKTDAGTQVLKFTVLNGGR